MMFKLPEIEGDESTQIPRILRGRANDTWLVLNLSEIEGKIQNRKSTQIPRILRGGADKTNYQSL
jgi:hypothetical protein